MTNGTNGTKKEYLSSETARIRARACSYAKSELVSRHQKEYDALYKFYLKKLGLSYGRGNARPSATHVKAGA